MAAVENLNKKENAFAGSGTLFRMVGSLYVILKVVYVWFVRFFLSRD